MCSILEDCLKEICIEECNTIDQDLLDTLLLPLLPSSQVKNRTAYEYISVVLIDNFERIQAPVSAFINHVLLGVALPGDAKISRLSAHVYPLIVELHEIHPELLRRVLPSISVQLQVEEKHTSSNPLKVLRELFSSDHADSATEFSKNFEDFLGRFDDVLGVVRLAKDNYVNLMSSTHNDCDATKGDKQINVSSKIDDAMAVTDLPLISRADDLHLAINVNSKIDPERNSVIDGVLANDHKKGNGGNARRGMDDWKIAITPKKVSISCSTTTTADSDLTEGVRDDNGGVVGLVTNVYSSPKRVSNSYKASKNLDIVGGVEG